MRLSLLLSLLLLARGALAAPTFLAGADGKDPGKGRVRLELTPGQKLKLDAGFFDGDTASAPKIEDPDGTYDWQLRCGNDDSAPCNAGTLTVAGHGRLLEIPKDLPPGARVVITHTRSDGTPDGQAELDLYLANADGLPAAHVDGAADSPSLDAPDASAPRDFESRYRPSRPAGDDSYGLSTGRGSRPPAADDSSRSFGGSSRGRSFGGGGGGSDDDDYSSYRSYRSHRRRSRDDSYDGYYSRGGGYGQGGGSPTTKRGYNRDNEVPVVSCKNVTSKDGQNKVVCEDEVHKVLRLKKTAKATAKPKKSVVAKKPPAKSAKKPASFR